MEAGPFSGRRLHFVGIGGAGMSGLALVARALGAEVTGSDSAESSYSARLREAGIEPRAGHGEPPPDGAEIVVSTAIAADNPELVHARAAAAPVLHRGDLLGEVSALKRTIAVAGTHGKTTTASMATLALVDAGRDPAFLIGGELRALGRERGLGRRRLGGGGGRRVRSLVPEARARGGGRDQRRARPPRHLPVARRAGAGIRELRRARGPGRARPGRGAAGPGRQPQLRHRLRRSPRRGRGAAAARIALQRWRAWRSSWRCRAATTC